MRYHLLLACLLPLLGSAQTFKVTGTAIPDTDIKLNDDVDIVATAATLDQFVVTGTALPAGTTYKVQFVKFDGTFPDCDNPITSAAPAATVKSGPGTCAAEQNGNVVNSAYRIEVGGVVFASFRIKSKIKDGTPCPIPSIEPELARIRKNLTPTPYGLLMMQGAGQYSGDGYVHLFYDQDGHSLFGVTPQGISNLQYVVHIVHLEDKDKPGRVKYTVSQTKGEFIDAPVTLDEDQVDPLIHHSKKPGQECPRWKWNEEVIQLGTATNDIEFDIVRTIGGFSADGDRESKSVSVETHRIKMSKVYNRAINIGFINTNLSNPVFSLVEAPDDPEQHVVKRAENGQRGIVTVMATFYTSPFDWFRNKDSIPFFRRGGRNFLADAPWYERIYPSIGVGISDKAFENLFVGFNWEVARGGSLWFGFHYGRVRTYDEPENFKFGETHTTQAEFDLRSDTKWRVSNFDSPIIPSVGVNLDLKLVTRLFTGNGVDPQ